MLKKKVVAQIVEYLEGELASAGSDRRDELAKLIDTYRFIPTRDYLDDNDVIIPSALVTLKHGVIEAYYYVAPSGGGLITCVEGKAVQVLTPQSPLGEAILGKKRGDKVTVDSRGGLRTYEIIDLR